ncbi:MAG TPA: hypothetical protein VM490_23155 [Armatimonadaceae bacterium]|nr:hypothetical protein [Armatimonadaceae bacterium]
MTLSLDAASVAWAREQPGGLADVMRRLLDDARRGAAATAAAPSSPAGNGGGGGADDAPELRAAYDRLIDRKLRHGLAEGEEHVLADLRARIFALDGEIVDGPAAPAAVYASRK